MGRKLLGRTVTAIILVSLAGPLPRVSAEQSDAGPPASRSADTGPAAEGRTQKKLSEIMRGSGEGTERTTNDGTTIMLEMLTYVLIIVVLAAAAIFVVKKVLPRIGVTVPSGKRISTLETVYLGPRKTVHLLRVGAREILVGSSRDRICMLADVTGAFEDKEDLTGASDD